MLNTLFSGVAFCANYYTLRIQVGQRDLQSEQLALMKYRARLFVDEEMSKKIYRGKIQGGPLGKQVDCDAAYARLVIRNDSGSHAKGCRAILIDIKELRGDHPVDMDEYQESLRFRVSGETGNPGEQSGIDIGYNYPVRFDICSIKDETKTPNNDIVTII